MTYLRQILVTATVLAAVLSATPCAFPQDFPCDGMCEPGMLKLEKGDASVFVGGQMQVQAALFTGRDNLMANGDLAEEEGFRVRRARIRLGGRLNKYVTFGLGEEMYDDEDSGGNLLDAWMDYTPIKCFGIKAGVVELPWTRSSLISSAYQSSIERPLVVRAMAPRRQAGAAFHSSLWDDRIRLQAGAYNSLHRGETFYDGYDSIGQSLGNRYSRFSYAARLDVAPLPGMDEPVPDIDKAKTLRLNLGGGYVFNDGAAQKIHAVTADVHAKWYGLALLAGWLHESDAPADEPTEPVSDAQTAEFQRSGWFVEADYTVFRRLLGIHARGEWLDPRHGEDNDDDETIVSGGVSVYAMDHMVKFQADYQHRIERFGPTADDDTLLTQMQLAF